MRWSRAMLWGLTTPALTTLALTTLALTTLALTTLGLSGCGCEEVVQLTDGDVTPMDGEVEGMDASPDGGPFDGDAGPVDAGPRGEITCQGHLYACGNRLDDDNDGLVDELDPDCLGPCDNNEAGFALLIPGGDSAPCRLDCYFDQDQGGGNDGCAWDHRCDPLEPDLECDFTDPPPPSADCPDEQADECAEVCSPLVPNGCDCFGCCNLPAGGDRWVFIGSVDASGAPTCTLDDVSDDDACHPCTPVANCLNDCGECELCLGRSELPASCAPDAGPDPVDAAVPPQPMCDDGRASCGLPGLPSCAPDEFCITGCCTFFG